MSITNGEAKKRRRLTKTIQKKNTSGRNSLACLPPESLFRGFEDFELIPKVSLKPLDLKIFLMNSKIVSDKNNEHTDIALHRKRLSAKCTVELLREDLTKLRESFGRKSSLLPAKDMSKNEDCHPEVKLSNSDITLPTNSCNRDSTALPVNNKGEMVDLDLKLPDSDMAVPKDNIANMDYDTDVKFADSEKDNDKDLDYDSDVKLPDSEMAALPDVNSTIVKLNLGTESPLTGTEVNLNCRICEKTYSNKEKLQNHLETKHMIIDQTSIKKTPKRVSFSDHVIIHEVTEYHRCRKCPKIFENNKFLKVHMRENHKKQKSYVCDYCEKKFMDRMIFKMHIKLHCDVCKMLLPNRKEYLEHRRNICRVLKLYNCKTCKNAFFNFMDLKDHSYEHINTYFICDICKEQFTTKCGVAHHISFLHSEKRPTTLYEMRLIGLDRLYLCNFCEESSVEREDIEKHVEVLPDLFNKAMTGYKDFYFCDQCSKKFDTEKEMLQHKWSHFLKNSDNSQIRLNGILSKQKPVLKKFYNINEKLPLNMQPQLVLEKIKVPGEELNEPVISKPAILEPVVSEPVISEPVVTEHVISEPVVSEPVVSEPVVIEHVISEPVVSEPVISEPVVSESVVSEPVVSESVISVDVNDFHNYNVGNKKAVIDPKSKKTIISKFQCEMCGKYLSSNYCLNRHIKTVHLSHSDLQCKVCEEVFVWPSLLESHKCIRYNLPEMPFDDARPEIHFDNLHQMYSNGFDELNISENDDYINNVDFEIPAPIVELTEYENSPILNNINTANQNRGNTCVNFPVLGYRVVMQEVPIEF